MSTRYSIEALNLKFAWPGKPELLAIDAFQVRCGERVLLRGPSGSGKSTLLGLLGGVLNPNSGQVNLLDTDITSLSASARDRFRGEHLGFIFQMFNLIPYLSVLENVLLPAEFSPARAIRIIHNGVHTHAGLVDEARRLLATLGLQDSKILANPVTELSIGQQQRVAAARALLGRPGIIIADEPTSALDTDARAEFLTLLMQECAAQQASLLFVSHDITLGSMFDRVISLAEINQVQANSEYTR